jgi:hypothetical protein
VNESNALRLRDAFLDRRCVSAWLGYGDVLFLGLGEDPPSTGETPPFKLNTNFAKWRVDGNVSAAWSDSGSNRTQLEAAVESLVGERVIGWELLARMGLRLTFTAAKVLTVEPWPIEAGISDAWCIGSPDGQILAVATDGRVVVVDVNLPVRDWFDASD